MKSRKQSLPDPAPTDGRSAGPSATQRWIFRAIALVSPLLLLAVIEVFLRIAGYGHPTNFFLKRKINGREMLIDNWQFGWRFFPKEIARTPEPVMFPKQKVPGTIRIFVFGESAAMGDPEPAFGLPRMLQAMLELKFPSNRFEVINVAMTAINSHVIREIAKDCAPLEGDVWVIYMGNNEVVGPFGSGTVFTRQVSSLSFIHLSLWMKQFRIVQWVSSLGRRGPVEWEGMEMFLKQRVRQSDPRMPRLRASFRENLDDIVHIGDRAGAQVLVGTVAVNLRDCPPFAPVHANWIEKTNETLWNETFARGSALERAGNFADAWQVLNAAAAVAGTNDNHAGLLFQLARCELGLGSNTAALSHFNLAKKFDTLRFRADDAINSAVRASPPPARVVDCEQLLATHSSNSIPGSELFYEHVHFTFAGNYLLARSFLDEIVRTGPTLTSGSTGELPTMEQCARRLVWTDWDRLQVYEEVRKRLQQPPFTAQLGHAERDRDWQRRIEDLSASLSPATQQLAISDYELAVRTAPNDWVLRENFARLLESNGDVTAALAQWNEVARLLPHDLQAQYHLGNLLDTLGRSAEALTHFRAALARNASSVETRSALALALSSLGRKAEAEREFNTALRIKPKFTEARVNLGQLLAQQGRTNEAIAQYKLALKNDTNSAAAHVNFGKLLNQRGDKAGAEAHYRAALAINPKHAVAHFNLGNLLRANQPAEALSHFAEAVRAKPEFAEAQLALAMELAQAGRTTEAEQHFTEAVRLQPGSADAHFNFGVALAKQSRFREAAKEFSQTLALEPGYPKAREFLERAEQRK